VFCIAVEAVVLIASTYVLQYTLFTTGGAASSSNSVSIVTSATAVAAAAGQTPIKGMHVFELKPGASLHLRVTPNLEVSQYY
jgi:hypothetical protein